MKVRAVYRDLMDEGKTDFRVKTISWDVPDDLSTEEIEKKVMEAAPAGFKFESLEFV